MALNKRILYFIAGSVPTAKESAEAAKLNTSMFRNASFVNEFDSIELCDAVAGLAPESYRKKYEYIAEVKVEKVVEAPPSPAKPTPPPSWAKGA